MDMVYGRHTASKSATVNMNRNEWPLGAMNTLTKLKKKTKTKKQKKKTKKKKKNS